MRKITGDGVQEGREEKKKEKKRASLFFNLKFSPRSVSSKIIWARIKIREIRRNFLDRSSNFVHTPCAKPASHAEV